MNRNRANRLVFVDIADAQFDAESHGLDSERVQESIHVKTVDGRVFVGVDALRVIWSVFPEMWAPAFVAGLPGVRELMGMGYRAFARNRHRIAGSCDDDGCGAGES
jgi:predicted DCC family thiol-disulfide oxidoreductase YuxK